MKHLPSRGFTLLISVLLVTVILSLSLSLLDVAYKQVVLSSTAKQSQYAFYTADSALECTLYWDQLTTGSAFDSSSQQVSTPVTNTYTYTGANQPFIIPAGVSALTVKMWGAGGGGGSDSTGGGGGYATAVVPVTPGEQIDVRVGGRGFGTSGGNPGAAGAGGSSTFPTGGAHTNTAGATGGAGGGGGYGGGGGGGSVLGAGGGGAGYSDPANISVTLTTGSNATPGNSGDASRGTAGNGGAAGTGAAGAYGLIIISYTVTSIVQNNPPPTIACLNQTIPLTSVLNGQTRTTTFSVPCATGGSQGSVTVYKTNNLTYTTTTIYANGYNSCTDSDPRRIERGIKVSY